MDAPLFKVGTMDNRRSDLSGAITPSRLGPNQDQLTDEEPLLESQSPVMCSLLDRARRAAAGDATILLTGESGTGKDVLARAIHKWSPRSNQRLVTINCAALPEQLLENELFGHARGAFTGAIDDKPGRLEDADSSTVLFDEIAELSPPLQTKFLQFVQEHAFERIGSNRTIRVDVRVIAASNRNLPREVAAGRFREDLYYRLNVISFRLPPLRERTADILALADWMLEQESRKAGRSRFTLSPAAAEAVLSYRWPGNLRELRNALECAVALTRSDFVGLDDLPESIRDPESGSRLADTHGTRLKDLEREHILRALAESATLEEAAATLGINVTTLWRKRKRYGIV
jgi:transcriptional regulator with PAS, ATPase and Fis domain